MRPVLKLIIFMPFEDKTLVQVPSFQGFRKLLPCMSPWLGVRLGVGHPCHGPCGNF